MYLFGKFVKQNIEKELFYINCSACQHYSYEQSFLGHLYSQGEYAKRDFEISLHFYLLASYKNNPYAFFSLASFYFLGIPDNHINIKKAIYYFELAAKKNFKIANFILGCIYHEGRYIREDIQEAIHFYKEASSFRITAAKINLGFIYKKDSIALAIGYFTEANKLKDVLGSFNLAKIFIYNNEYQNKLDQSIKLLIDSFHQNFYHSRFLLCLALIKKVGFDLNNIK